MRRCLAQLMRTVVASGLLEAYPACRASNTGVRPTCLNLPVNTDGASVSLTRDGGTSLALAITFHLGED